MPDSKGRVVWSVLVFFAVGGTLVSLLPLENRVGGVAQATPECTNDSDCLDDGYNCTMEVCNLNFEPQGMNSCESVPVNSSCSDGFDCTIDICDPFFLGRGATNTVSGKNGCFHLPNNSVCDDSDLCTDDFCVGDMEGAETAGENGFAGCQYKMGYCVIDQFDCTDQACDPALGCNPPNNSFCDDGDACTENFCDPETFMNMAKGTTGADDWLGCVTSQLNCDDGIDCTDDSCDSGAGCENLANDSLCDDGVDCTDDACIAAEGCENLANHSFCDDGNECTDDSCDPGHDHCAGENQTDCGVTSYLDQGCVYANNSAPCDNDNMMGNIPCDAMDICSEGACVDHPDSDGDGICDPDDARPDDPDPSGYIYDEETGEILPGGMVTVVPEPGATGTVMVIADGSTGMYAFTVAFGGVATTSGNPSQGEVYRLVVTAPPECRQSSSCLAQPGPLDPTGMSNPVAMGAYPSGVDPGFLESADCADNVYYRSFRLEPGDPNIINNNFPIACGPVPAPAVSGKVWWTAVLLMLAGVAFVALRRYAR
jgi:hypothetical protein